MKTGTVIAGVGLLLTFSGCIGGESDSADEISLSITPPAANMNDEVIVRVTGGDGVSNMSWSVLDEAGGPVAGCQGTESLTCRLELPGRKTVRLQAAKRDGRNVSTEGTFDILDPNAQANQAPNIVLDIKDAGSRALVSTVATFRTLEKGSASFKMGQVLEFDFSRTSDDVNSSDLLQYSVNFGQGFEDVTKSFSHTFSATGTFPIIVRVADQNGNSAEKTFVAFVECAEAEYPPIVIDPAKISITSSGKPNFFDYNATGAVSGGRSSADFRYSWDFNGDGIFDNDWSNLATINAYSHHANVRSVSLKVWDVACNYFAKTTVDYNFVIPQSNATPGELQGPQIPGYPVNYFMQATLRPKTPATAPAHLALTQNVDLSAIQLPGPEAKRVICDYKKAATTTSGTSGTNQATFTISALNAYNRPGKSGTQHGMDLRVTGIIDPTGMTGGGSVNTSSAVIDRINYYTDEGSDSDSRMIYSKAAPCQLNLVVTPFPPGTGTCSTDPKFGYPVRIDGTYSCELVSGTQRLNATKGAFFCEVAKVDACPPGGGGSTGGIPPVPR